MKAKWNIVIEKIGILNSLKNAVGQVLMDVWNEDSNIQKGRNSSFGLEMTNLIIN